MLYTTLTIKGREYKLRLDAKNSVSLERKLGKSPLALFMDAENSVPKLDDLIEIFAASLNKYQHGITIDATYDLYDEYIEEGGTFTDFIPVILDVFKTSGYFKDEPTAQVGQEKN